MEGTYSVAMDGVKVGTIILSRDGLYYRLSCRCSIDGDQMSDLMMETGRGIQKIGLMTPAGDRLTLQKRIAVKKLGEGNCSFFLQPRGAHKRVFLPVDPNQPFAKLSLLKECKFAVYNGCVGVELPRKNNGEKVENKS